MEMQSKHNRRPNSGQIRTSKKILGLMVCIVLVVTANCTASHPLSTCIMNCSGPDMQINYFVNSFSQPVNTWARRCIIMTSSSTTSRGCKINLDSIFDPLKDKERESLIVLRMECLRPTQVVVDGQHTAPYNRNLILYLQLFSCRMPWSSLSQFGRVGDLQVLMIDTLGETELKESVVNNDTKYDGLRNLGTLTLDIRDGTTTPALPTILSTYRWPMLAELYLNNVNVSRLPTDTDVSMPRLQSLTLKNTQFRAPPLHFPWDQASLVLPRNLSRSTFLHYHESKKVIFPPNMYLRRLSITHNNMADLRNFKFRGRLLHLELNHNNITQLSGELFSDLNDLQYLDLSNNQLRHLPTDLFKSQVALRVLDLHGNRISNISLGTFRSLVRLVELKLNGNDLVHIRSGTFSTLRELQALYLNNNRIRIVEHGAILTASLNLTEIFLQYNRLRNIPEFFLDSNNFIHSVNLSYNMINFENASHFFENLGVLIGLTSETVDCPPTPKYFDLRYNDISTFPYSLKWSKRSVNALTYVLTCHELEMYGNKLLCNCNIYDFYKFLLRIRTNEDILPGDPRESLRTWSCDTPATVKGLSLIDVTPDKMNCLTKSPFCPPQCDCYRQAVSTDMLIDCNSRNLTTLPQFVPDGRIQLEMAGNLIEKLEPRPYLTNATKLVLSNNKIRQIDPATFGFFTELRELYLDGNNLAHLPQGLSSANVSRIELNGNYLSCDCKNLWLKGWLRKSPKNIPDWADLKCADGDHNGERIVDVPDSKFTCITKVKGQVTVPIVICLVVVLIILVVNVTIYRFSLELKVFVYSRFNWHPFDRVDDDDPERIYDAFVSYSSQDYKWVVHHLRHTLETHNPPYRLCVHDRDFIVGETIFDNIMNSVQLSKRMIMVLSQNYVNSEWCMMEFRTAHQKVLQDRSKYLIIILFDDVDKGQLDEELLAYLNTSTYLEVSSRWFWKKLLYAMPDLKKNRPRSSESVDCEMTTEPCEEENAIDSRGWGMYKKH